jgi:hypothetical protein
MTGCLKGNHQYVALRRKEVVRWAISPFTEKTLITREKEEKIRQINSKRKKDLRLAPWNVRSLYRPGGLGITINELRKYKIAIAAIQEMRWDELIPQVFTSNGYNIWYRCYNLAALPIIINLEQFF